MGRTNWLRPRAGKWSWPAVLVLFFALQLVIVWVPLVYFLANAFAGGGQYWGELFASAGKVDSVLRTIEISVETTVVCVVLGYLYVGAMVHGSRLTRAMLLVTVIVPFLTSIVVRTYAWIIVLGNSGPINGTLLWLFGPGAEVQLIYNRTGVLIGMAHVLMPFFVLPLFAVMSHVPRRLSRAARTLGANRVDAFIAVDLPLSLPGAAAGAVLVFIQALGFYVTPAILGGLGDTMVSQFIDGEMVRFANLGAAAALSVLLVGAVAACVVAFRVLYPLELLFVQDLGTVADVGRRSKRTLRRQSAKASGVFIGMKQVLLRFRLRLTTRLSRLPWMAITRVAAVVIAIWFVAPVLIVVPVSFIGEPYLHFPPDTYSLRWYNAVFADHEWRTAAINSVLTGLVAVVVASLVGIPLAFVLVRGRLSAALRGGVIAFLILPVVVPVIIISVGVYVWYLELGIIADTVALGVAHAVLGLPFMTLVLVAALRDFDIRIERAARSLGAGPLETLRVITLPILAGALLSGALLTFLISFDELLIARAVTNFETVTLPVKLWTGTVEEISPALGVVSTLSLALALLISAAVIGVGLRSGSPARGRVA